MSFKEKLRKVFLCVFLGGSFLGSQISHEKITEENEVGKSTNSSARNRLTGGGF
jgi:hypothetical protein